MASQTTPPVAAANPSSSPKVTTINKSRLCTFDDLVLLPRSLTNARATLRYPSTSDPKCAEVKFFPLALVVDDEPVARGTDYVERGRSSKVEEEARRALAMVRRCRRRGRQGIPEGLARREPRPPSAPPAGSSRELIVALHEVPAMIMRKISSSHLTRS